MPATCLEGFDFDREFALRDVLVPVDKKHLSALLEYLLGDFAITDTQGGHCLGEPSAVAGARLPLVLEIEPVGYLHTRCADEPAQAMGQQLVMMELRAAQKYLMASALHIEAIQEDYDALCLKHELLQASEARYKALCEQLDQKVAEQIGTIESTQRKLFESEKLASVGQLAAGIAHEINNPIGFVNSNLNTARGYIDELLKVGALISANAGMSVLRESWKQADMDFVLGDFSDLLGESIDGIQRVAAIIADLKLFSNVDAEEELVVDINKYLAAGINVARTSLDSQTSLEFDAGVLPQTRCRPGYLGQVILALIMNSADAIAAHKGAASAGHIEVRSYCLNHRIHVEVIDNGPGIPAHLVERIFDPFFTTKDVGKGKGLGLTTCRDIVTAHGGEMTIDTGVAQGARIGFWLPVVTGSD